MKEEFSGMNRRTFLKGSAMTAAAFTIVPRHVLGGPGYTAPSDKLNIAGVGVGGMGKVNLKNLASQNIVALCDVDYGHAAPVFEQYPKAKRYQDYRRMLDERRDIDGLVIATSDHTHAVIALAGMQMGKHLYVQKPLTATVHEARVLAEEAARTGVVTQMGNQGHAGNDARVINEIVQSGMIGDVREVHAWTNRPIWPQGVPYPKATPPVPDGLAWDLFVGPAAYRPYHEAYHPFGWRGWTDWGVGAIGDMGAHLIDHPYWALDLDAPDTVSVTSTPFNGESYPLATMTTYTFPKKGQRPALKMVWYDGGLQPPFAEVLQVEKLDWGGGVLMIGDGGMLLHDTYGKNPRLLPSAERMQDFKAPKQTYARVETSHEMDWVRAVQENRQPSSPFSYAGPLTETMLLGVVALHAPNRVLNWDSAQMTFTNAPELNEHIKREYREGWALTR
ncbi:MAG: Gfo/Idh/MocA family oxidoreductase [Catalinimonas sp.]